MQPPAFSKSPRRGTACLHPCWGWSAKRTLPCSQVLSTSSRSSLPCTPHALSAEGSRTRYDGAHIPPVPRSASTRTRAGCPCTMRVFAFQRSQGVLPSRPGAALVRAGSEMKLAAKSCGGKSTALRLRSSGRGLRLAPLESPLFHILNPILLLLELALHLPHGLDVLLLLLEANSGGSVENMRDRHTSE